MTQIIRKIGRSLLPGLLALTVVLTPLIARAIAPADRVLAQQPAVQIPHQPAPPTVPSEVPLREVNPFSLMPGGQLAAIERPTNQTSGEPFFVPRQEQVTINRTNYDPRMATDIYGNPVHNAPIVVLHETVGSATSAVNTFRNTNLNDNDQVSYHSLIKRDGTIVYLVPPEMRAFGAGNSVFNGANGAETVRLDRVLPASVNNFAYHTSLESPADGRDNRQRHSGYTDAQYRSLAWLVAHTQVPDNRITTHRAVDRSGNRRDPRSFDFQRFFTLLHTYSTGESEG